MADYAENEGVSMPREGLGLSRRGFLAAAAAAAVSAGAKADGQAASHPVSAPTSQPTAGKTPAKPAKPAGSGVVKMFSSESVLDGGQVKTERLTELIDRCVVAAAGTSDAKAAWRKYVTPGKKVLLKFSQLSGRGMNTERGMLAATVASLVKAGCKKSDLIVADCQWSAYEEGLAPTPPGWSERSIALPGGSEPLRAYLDAVETIINIPSVCDHNLAGVACAMMNVSLPLIRRPARFYRQGLHEAIVAICSDAQILSKIKLTLVNALRVLFDGGPVVSPDSLAYDHSVWASTDMVAIDRLALEWIERRRRQAELKTLEQVGRPARFLQIAAGKGLGQADLRRIRWERNVI